MTKFYTTSDAARICNVHRNTIIGCIRKNQLKIYRTPGGHARIAEADLLDFCRQRNLPVSLEGGANNRLLIVDDDPLLVKVLRAGLSRHGYEVRVAENGYDAGFFTVEWRPDLMLLDIMLPDVQGDEVARRVRSSGATSSLPIIAMSAVSDQSRIDAILDAGANEFIPKPFEIAALRDRIVALIGQVRPEAREGRRSDTGVLASGASA